MSDPQVTEAPGRREVAVLADGPWAPRRYWRSELEATQAASRSMGYPDDHSSAVLRCYHPTDTYTPDAGPEADQPARLWRYRPPAPSGQVRCVRRGDDPPDAATLLEAALALAARGWPVFALGRTKRPVANCRPCHEAGDEHDRQACACLTCHGFYAATTDPDRVRAILAAVPGGLLAVRTGVVAGLVVVDIDPDHGGRIDHGLMTPTYTVATGSGGWHLYYAHPGDGPILSRRMPDRDGVDIKADGGYVVAPPSLHPVARRRYVSIGGRPVNEMPPRLLEICRTPPAHALPATPPSTAAPRPTPATLAGGRGGISFPPALLAAHLRAVTTAPRGRRRVTLYGAARGMARMVAADALDTTTAVHALWDAGRQAEQTDRDIAAAIAGGFRDEGVPLAPSALHPTAHREPHRRTA